MELMNRQVRWVVSSIVLTMLSVLSGMSMATETCSSIISSYNLNSCSASCKAQLLTQNPECFGSSSNTAAATASVKATSVGQMLAVSSALGARSAGQSAPPGVVSDAGQRTGLAGGSAGKDWNVWSSISSTSQNYDRGTYFFNAADRTNKFDTRVMNVVVGGDYQWAQNLAVGISGAFDDGSGSLSAYTIATPTAAKTLKTSGYSFAPYLGWQINKDWAMDASIGWGTGKSTVDGSIKTDSKRFFYGANLGYTSWSGNWQMTGKGSYLFGQEKSSDSTNNGTTLASTAVNNDVGQFRLAGQAAYWMNGTMPYIGLSYSTDSRSSNASADQKTATEIGNTAWQWSLGVNFISLKSGVTGGLAYELETSRSRSKSDRLMANINFRF